MADHPIYAARSISPALASLETGADPTANIMMAAATLEKNFEARHLPLTSVTVFNDRAELRRTFDVTLSAGLNHVVVNNVCSSIEPDSIRVDGQGLATIHEVNYKSEYASSEETDSPQVKELVKQVEALELKRATVQDLLTIFKDRLTSLNDLVKNLGQVTLSKKESAELVHFDSDAEATLDKFYDYHERQAINLNARVRSSEIDIRRLDEDINKLHQQININRADTNTKRSISITLETTAETTTAKVELTYQVYNASWTPSYDIRVQTTESAQLKLLYYGLIVQQTGESWDDVDVILSTAQPRKGGVLPKIGTLQAQFYKPLPPPVAQPMVKAKRFAAQPSLFGSAQQPEMMYAATAAGNAEFAPPPALGSITQEVEHHALASTFKVPQKKTIPSDNSEHKVTIAALELQPMLHFDCVPSKSTNVYLTASLINASAYPLLAGSASVYVDGSYSTKLPLKAVSAGDKFDVHLGVDPTINVELKPAHNFNQQTGVLSKTAVTIKEHRTVVKNTKQTESIVLTLVQHVPKSTDEKIKVKLLQPDLKPGAAAPASTEDLTKLQKPSIGTHLNAAHNLEWTTVLAPGEEREFVVRWSVEAPATEPKIEFVERF